MDDFNFIQVSPVEEKRLKMGWENLAEKIPGADEKEYNSRTVGIEKEYRLSKVSKVSSIMYGQDGIQIVYGEIVNDVKIDHNGVITINERPAYIRKMLLEVMNNK